MRKQFFLQNNLKKSEFDSVLQINSDRILPYITKAIQEMKADYDKKIKELEDRIKELEGQGFFPSFFHQSLKGAKNKYFFKISIDIRVHVCYN